MKGSKLVFRPSFRNKPKSSRFILCVSLLQFVAGRHFKDVFGGDGIIWYPSKNVCLLLSTQRWVVFTKKVKDWTVKPDGNVA